MSIKEFEYQRGAKGDSKVQVLLRAATERKLKSAMCLCSEATQYVNDEDDRYLY